MSFKLSDVRKVAIALTVVLSACATATAPIDTPGWHGKTLALARHSRSGLQIVGMGDELLVGATSGAWNVSNGSGAQLVAENDIEDPAEHVADALFDAAAEHYGVVAAPEVAAPSLANVSDLVRLGQGSDLLLEVTGGTNVVQRPFSHRYWVATNMDARVIDVQAGKALREGFCQQRSGGDPDPLTYDELTGDHARRLKLILARQTDICLAKFKTEVLGIAPQAGKRIE